MKRYITIPLFILPIVLFGQNKESIDKNQFGLKLIKQYENGLRLYYNECGNIALNGLVEEFISNELSIKNSQYHCFFPSDSLVEKRLVDALQKEYGIEKKSCMVYFTLDSSSKNIAALLLLLSHKKFLHQIKRLNDSQYFLEHPTGELRTKKRSKFFQKGVCLVVSIDDNSIIIKRVKK